MKLKVAEYNERPIGLRVAHIDFFMLPTGEIMCTPYTKEETVFADALEFAVSRNEELQIQVDKITDFVVWLYKDLYTMEDVYKKIKEDFPGDYHHAIKLMREGDR